MVGIKRQPKIVRTFSVNYGRLKPADMNVFIIVAVGHGNAHDYLTVERRILWMLGGERGHRGEQLSEGHTTNLHRRVDRVNLLDFVRDIGKIDGMTRAAATRPEMGVLHVGQDPEPDAIVKPRRKRGPNKPKPTAIIVGSIAVRTEASMGQAAIVELLSAHAASDSRIGPDAAAEMELQVNSGNGWEVASPNGIAVRFVTKGHK